MATLASGMKIQYEALLSTMPLDVTLQWLGQPRWADELSHRRGSTCLLHAYQTILASFQGFVLSWKGLEHSLDVVQLIPHRGHWTSRPVPTWPQVLAVLPGGQLPFLQDDGLLTLCSQELSLT